MLRFCGGYGLGFGLRVRGLELKAQGSAWRPKGYSPTWALHYVGEHEELLAQTPGRISEVPYTTIG